MKISMNIVEDSIKSYIITKSIKSDSNMCINSVLFADLESTHYQSNCLYVFEAKDFPVYHLIPTNTNIICFGEPSAYSLDSYSHINLIIVTDSIDIKIFFNLILSIIEEYNSWEIKLNQLITISASLQKFIDLGASKINVPMCMLDCNHSVLAITSKYSSDDALWHSMEKGYGYLHYDIISLSKPKLKDVAKSYLPVEMISNISNRYIMVSSIHVNNKVVAFLGMHKTKDIKKTFDKSTYQLYLFFIDILSDRLQRASDLSTSIGFMYEQFLNDILEKKVTNPDEINQKNKLINFKMGDQFQIVLIRFPEQTERTEYLDSVMPGIRAIIPNANCISHGSDIVAIINLQHVSYLSNSVIENLSKFLKAYLGYCALSPVFYSLKEIPQIFSQASAAMGLGITRHPETNIYHYYDYAVIHCFDILSANVNKSTLCHPKLHLLLRYDKKHNTDYFDTLKIYLANNCNVSHCSKLMTMHRNSFLYRIQRIEELLNCDFEDADLRFQFLFSIYIWEY